MDAGGQESVKNYVDRMQAGLRQRLGVCGAGSAEAARGRMCADIEIARPGKAAAEEREFTGQKHVKVSCRVRDFMVKYR